MKSLDNDERMVYRHFWFVRHWLVVMCMATSFPSFLEFSKGLSYTQQSN
jgi:hypothetical protein